MSTGKCKKLNHKMSWKNDGIGRKFYSCNNCGVTPVIIKHNESGIRRK